MPRSTRSQFLTLLVWVVTGPGMNADTFIPTHPLLVITKGSVEIQKASGEKSTAKAPEEIQASEASSASEPSSATVRMPTLRILKAGDSVATVEKSEAVMIFPVFGATVASEKSKVKIPASENPNDKNPVKKTHPSLELLKGNLYLDLDASALQKDRKKVFLLKTPSNVLAVKGTQFAVGLDTALKNGGRGSRVWLESGTVEILGEDGKRVTELNSRNNSVEVADIDPAGSLQQTFAISEQNSMQADYESTVTKNPFFLIPAEGKRRFLSIFSSYKNFHYSEHSSQRNSYKNVYNRDPEFSKAEIKTIPEIDGEVIVWTYKRPPKTAAPSYVDIHIKLDRGLKKDTSSFYCMIRGQPGLSLMFGGASIKLPEYLYIDRRSVTIPKQSDTKAWLPVYLPLVAYGSRDGTRAPSKRPNSTVEEGDPFTAITLRVDTTQRIDTSILEEFEIQISPLYRFTNNP